MIKRSLFSWLLILMTLSFCSFLSASIHSLSSDFTFLNTENWRVEDIDGDGYYDCLKKESGELRVYWGEDFSEYTALSDTDEWAMSLEVFDVFGDIDNDGNIDIALLSTDTPAQDIVKLVIFRNKGDRTFEEEEIMNKETDYSITFKPPGPVVEDIDGDGWDDILVKYEYYDGRWKGGAFIFWNDHGTFSFDNKTDIYGQNFYPCVIKDINHDGMKDLVGYYGTCPPETNWYYGTKVFIQSSPREFTLTFDVPNFAGGEGDARGVGDVDGDGEEDLVLCKTDDWNEEWGYVYNSIYFFKGNGDGTFQDGVEIWHTDQVVDFKFFITGDLNNDGKDEVALFEFPYGNPDNYLDVLELEDGEWKLERIIHSSWYDLFPITILDYNSDEIMDIVCNWGIALNNNGSYDINKDGVVDIKDVILALRQSIGLDPADETTDINRDGVVDTEDVILILRKALGLD